MIAADHSAIWETLRGALGGGAGWWLFSSAVQTMPIPRASERWYGWFYEFVQRVGANHTLLRTHLESVDAEAAKVQAAKE